MTSAFGANAGRPDTPEPVDGLYVPRLPFMTQSAAAVEDEVAYLSRFIPEASTEILSIGFDVIAAATAQGEIQTETIDATGGTRTLSFDGHATAAIAYNANAAAIQAALILLPNIDSGDVVVTGSGPFTYTFGGQYALQDVPALVADSTALTGNTHTSTIATSQAGRSIKVDVGIYDATLKRLSSSGLHDGEGAVGSKFIDLPKAVGVQAGAAYYAGFASKDASAATILIGTTQADAGDLIGDDAGRRELVTKTAACPLPANVPVGASPATHAPILSLRHSGAAE